MINTKVNVLNKNDKIQNAERKFIWSNFIYRNLYQIFLTIDGRCLYWFFYFLYMGKFYCVLVLLYFSTLCIVRSLNIVRILRE